MENENTGRKKYIFFGYLCRNLTIHYVHTTVSSAPALGQSKFYTYLWTAALYVEQLAEN